MNNTVSLKKNYEFQNVYKRGKSIANRDLVMYVFPNKKNYNRLGICVSKKVGNSVVRSRVTRLIRESYRLNENSFKCGYDIIVIARVTITGKKCKEVSKSLLHLMHKQKIIL
ncbi:MAG: ribonuclease P protein component [Lachnospirales bacterium]